MPFGQQCLDRNCGDPSRRVVVEPQHYLADMGMLGKIPHQCGGQAAFLDFCPWFVDPGEGEQVFTAPNANNLSDIGIYPA